MNFIRCRLCGQYVASAACTCTSGACMHVHLKHAHVHNHLEWVMDTCALHCTPTGYLTEMSGCLQEHSRRQPASECAVHQRAAAFEPGGSHVCQAARHAHGRGASHAAGPLTGRFRLQAVRHQAFPSPPSACW